MTALALLCRGGKDREISLCSSPWFTVRVENVKMVMYLLDMQLDECAWCALVSLPDQEGYTALEQVCMWGCH